MIPPPRLYTGVPRAVSVVDVVENPDNVMAMLVSAALANMIRIGVDMYEGCATRAVWVCGIAASSEPEYRHFIVRP